MIPAIGRTPSVIAAIILGLAPAGACGGSGATTDAGGNAGTGPDAGGGGTGGALMGTGGTSGAADGGSSGASGDAGVTTVVTTLAGGEKSPGNVLVDSDTVYWTSNQLIRQMKKIGGSPTTLYSAPATVLGIVADDTSLYWTVQGVGVMSGPKVGGATMMLASGVPNLPAADADHVYWVDGQSPANLRRVAKVGGAMPETLATEPRFGVLLVDDQSLYWAESETGRLRRIAKTGGTITDLRPADGSTVTATALDATTLYFATAGSLAQTSVLSQVPKAGGAPGVVESKLDIAVAISAPDNVVYWLTGSDSAPLGYVAALPKAGGDPTHLATDIKRPTSLTVDATSIYWTEASDLASSNGRVRRLAR
jgi:hypothetical protein